MNALQRPVLGVASISSCAPPFSNLGRKSLRYGSCRCFATLQLWISPVTRPWNSLSVAFSRVPPSASAKVIPLPTENVSETALSAKERRKLRNERREVLKACQEPWKEVVENRLLTDKPVKIRTWEQDADVDRLRKWGTQWWMVQVTRNLEQGIADYISSAFAAAFPGNKVEVLVPTVPVNAKLKNGTVSQARKKLYKGIVLFSCVMDREVFNFVKQIPGVYDFLGNIAGNRRMPMSMPAPVSVCNMAELFKIIHQEEKAHEEFKERCRTDSEEQEKTKVAHTTKLKLELGCTVRVLSGPFTEFTGIVTEIQPELAKLKVILTIFGNPTESWLELDNAMVIASA